MQPFSLIYQFLALQLNIMEANATLDRLGLSELEITNVSQVVEYNSLPPKLLHYEVRGLSSGIWTRNLCFSVDSRGTFAGFNMARVLWHGRAPAEDWGDDEGREGVLRESVSDEGAYRMARAWLERTGVDVADLESKYRPRTEHRVLPLNNRKTVSSEFMVYWDQRGSHGKDAKRGAEVFLNPSRKWLQHLCVSDVSFYRHPIPEIPHAIAVNLLPDEPVRQFFHLRPEEPAKQVFRRPGIYFTNVFALLETPPEYERQAKPLLLAETRNIIVLLGCDQLDPATEANLTDFYINPPAFGYGGRLEFTNGEVQFDCHGRLRYFSLLPRGQTNFWLWLGTKRSLISTNEAYQIATQKLAALSINLDELDSKGNRDFLQDRYYNIDKHGRKLWFDSLVYSLIWRDKRSPGRPPLASVMVCGDIKQIGRIELNDTSCWKRAPVIVPTASTNAPVRRPTAPGAS